MRPTMDRDLNFIVLTPAFNEADSISQVVREVMSYGFRIVVIDDGSSDATSKMAKDCGATVLRMPFQTGVGGALRCGMRFAVENSFNAIVQIDADGQHPIHQIRSLLQAAHQTGADMVIGSRFLSPDDRGMTVSAIRRIAMKVLAWRASRAVNAPLTDVTSGFRLIQGQLLTELAKELPAYFPGDTFEAVVASGKAGYRVVEIPVTIAERTHGVSSASTFQATKWTARAVATSILAVYPRLQRKFD